MAQFWSFLDMKDIKICNAFSISYDYTRAHLLVQLLLARVRRVLCKTILPSLAQSANQHRHENDRGRNSDDHKIKRTYFSIIDKVIIKIRNEFVFFLGTLCHIVADSQNCVTN